jgi:hypothetical protein
MCPLTFCRKKGIYDVPVYGLVWQATTSVMTKEGRDECHMKNLQQKHSLNGSGWTKQHVISSIEDNLALKQGVTHLILANQRPALIILEDTSLHVGSKDKDDMIACTLVSTNHQSRVDYRPSLERPLLWLQDDVPKPLKMKPACKYWWSSFLYHKDRWCIINWATLCHTSRRQRPSRKNSSIHLQWTSIHQPRPN